MIDANLVLYVCEILLCCVQTPLHTLSWLVRRLLAHVEMTSYAASWCGNIGSSVYARVWWRLLSSSLFLPTSGFYYDQSGLR